MTGDDRGAPRGAQGDRSRAAFSLRRWSQRKHEAARGVREDPRAPALEPSPGATAGAGASAPPAAEPSAHVPDPPAPKAGASAARPALASTVAALPSIDSLTADSDFAPFMRPGVDPDLRREALKKLLHDTRFNVMDGLDVYIDDYTKTKPIDPSLARRLLARLHPRSPAVDDEPAAAAVAEADGAALGAGGSSNADAVEPTNAADPATPAADPATPAAHACGDASALPALHSERQS